MIGFIAGSFDVIHPGYIYMFEESKKNCNYLIVALQDDPTIERPGKLKPILTLLERIKILESIKYIDEIVTYNTEKELLEILNKIKPNIRFLGDDYKGKKITGEDLGIPIYYLDRSHGWSTTRFKTEISEQTKIKKINY